jgi:hypothetical protein
MHASVAGPSAVLKWLLYIKERDAAARAATFSSSITLVFAVSSASPNGLYFPETGSNNVLLVLSL